MPDESNWSFIWLSQQAGGEYWEFKLNYCYRNFVLPTSIWLSIRYLMIHRRYQLQTYGNKILSRNKDITNVYLTQTIIFTMTSLLTRMIRMKWVIKKIYVYDQPSSPLQPYIGVCIFFSSIANDCLKNLKNIVLFEATATFQLLSLRNIT